MCYTPENLFCLSGVYCTCLNMKVLLLQVREILAHGVLKEYGLPQINMRITLMIAYGDSDSDNIPWSDKVGPKTY